MRAFLFPGQGSQYVGMADAIPDRSEALSLFARASEILRMDLWKLVQSGEEEVLVRTENAQPALFVTEMAWFYALARRGVMCDMAAGHSLGEFTALCAANVFSFEDGVSLVRRRGEIMANAVSKTPGSMVALVGMNIDDVNTVLGAAQSAGIVEIANFNAPDQAVLSGEESAMQRVIVEASALGHGRAIKLRVGAPFHSSLMAQGSVEFETALRTVPFSDPRFPVVNNVAGVIEMAPGRIKENLVLQFRSPVQWIQTMKTFEDMGSNQYLEVGPRTVLSALARKANSRNTVQAVEAGSWG